MLDRKGGKADGFDREGCVGPGLVMYYAEAEAGSRGHDTANTAPVPDTALSPLIV